jgi:hypothetical protein
MVTADLDYAVEHVKRIATPGLFARTASNGRWRMGRHHSLIDEYLTAVFNGRIKRLIISQPPRHGKSEQAAKYFPAWWLGMRPDNKVMYASAVHDLAMTFSGDARDILMEWGPSLFGVEVRGDKHAQARWQIEGHGGECRAFGVGGSPYGHGMHLGIIDDYHGNAEEAASETERNKVWRWYTKTWRNRLEEDAAEVIIATRYHPDDLIGRLLKHEADEWTVVRLPALAEEDDLLGRKPGEALCPWRFSRKHLEGVRDFMYSIGEGWAWECLYQQNPPTSIAQEFPPEWFGEHIWCDRFPPASEQILRVMALDPSTGDTDKPGDYSAFVRLAVAGGILYVDADIERRDIVSIVARGYELSRQFNPAVFGVEGVGFQKTLRVLFERVGVDRGWPCPIKMLHHNPKIKKAQRIKAGLTPRLAQGQIRFVRCPGCSLLVQQLQGFPASKHDDGPDALEMAVRLAGAILSGEVSPEEDEADRRVYA